jgi:EAL domain-containing protein (putative c-di-GMP-specific phosphodiesterase class I)
MAHALGLTVIGEGIENSRQLSTLRLLSCDLGQGYFLAPPLTETALAQRVGTGQWHHARAADGPEPGARSLTDNR